MLNFFASGTEVDRRSMDRKDFVLCVCTDGIGFGLTKAKMMREQLILDR